MFSRALILFVFTLPFLATATAVPRDGRSNVCVGGSVQCCNSVQKAADSSDILQLLSIAVPVQGLVGVTCTPISALGGAHINCNQQTLCCNGDSFTGGYVTGCTSHNSN